MLKIQHLAAVAVSSTTFGYDKRYQYIIPLEMDGRVNIGARVLVPFGSGNRKRIAVVIRIDRVTNEDLSKFKPIISIIDTDSLLNDEMIDLLLWIRNTTLCTYFDAFRTLIPIGLSVNLTTKYFLSNNTNNETRVLSNKATVLLDKLKADMSVLKDAEKNVIDELVQNGFLIEENLFKRRKKDETITMIRFTDDYVNGKVTINFSSKQKDVVSLIEESTTASLKEITYICGVTSAVVKNLIQKNVLESYEYEVINTPDVESVYNINDIILNDEQQKVFNGISELIDKKAPDVALLYGVTGSGKT